MVVVVVVGGWVGGWVGQSFEKYDAFDICLSSASVVGSLSPRCSIDLLT